MKLFSKWLKLSFALVALACVTWCNPSRGVGPDEKPPGETPKTVKAPRPFARLFVQDLKTSSLKWADVRVDEKNQFTLDTLAAVEGHFGHHDMAFDAEKRFGFFTNPGDGTISVLSLKTLEVVTTFNIGGTPTAIVACGSRITDD